MNNDMFEVELVNVMQVIEEFVARANSFNHAKAVYSSSYLSTGSGTVKKINDKYGIDRAYSSISANYASLLLVCKGYLSSCLELEKGLSDEHMGELDQYISASVKETQGLLNEISLYELSMKENPLSKYALKNIIGGYPLPKGSYFPNGAGLRDGRTNGYFAWGFKYNPNMIGPRSDYDSLRREYKIIRSPQERASQALDYIVDMISKGGYKHNRYATTYAPTLVQAMAKFIVSCSGTATDAYHFSGNLAQDKPFKHTPGKGKPGYVPVTNDPKTRVEGGFKGLKNGTIIHYYKDGENYKIDRTGLDPSLKIIEIKVDEFPKYDKIPDKYKKKGTAYVYDTHIAMDLGYNEKTKTHKVLSLTHEPGYEYTKSEVIKELKDGSTSSEYVYDTGVYDIFIPND